MRKLRVFHGLVNYGTQAGLFSQELRNQGIDAISVCYYDKFRRVVDFELLHGGSIIVKVFKHSINFVLKILCFFKYNTFHFYYGQTLFQNQTELPFYRFFGKKVLMEYLGNDVQGYEVSVNKYKWTNINHYIPVSESKKYDQGIQKRLLRESQFLNVQIVCAPVYSEFVLNSQVLPTAIDTNHFPYTELEVAFPIRIMHAPTHRGFKGTDFIMEALQKLILEGEPIEIMLVEGVTHDELKERYKRCHIFIDQIMGGWYGTASIEAMAIGRPVICSVRKEYFEYIDYGEKLPIVHADPDSIYETVKTIIRDPTKLKEIGRASRQFVEEIHDVKKVTKKLIQIYHSL